MKFNSRHAVIEDLKHHTPHTHFLTPAVDIQTGRLYLLDHAINNDVTYTPLDNCSDIVKSTITELFLDGSFVPDGEPHQVDLGSPLLQPLKWYGL